MSTPSSAPINVFIDSDGPVADFDSSLKASGLSTDEFKHSPGVYLWLPITRGAENALELLNLYDSKNLIRTWILTKTPSKSPYAYTEKVLWYRKNFPWLEDRVIITHDKHVIGGPKDFLLDDRPHKANANLFKGKFIVFDVENPFQSWSKFMFELEGILLKT